MPRQSRIDAPGALHHIICRGIKRRRIFEDDQDGDNFMQRRYRLKAEGYSIERVAQRVSEIFDISPGDVLTPGKQAHRVKARSVLAYWAVRELGMSATAVSLSLGLSQSATSRAIQRGRDIAEELQLNSEMIRNASMHGRP